MNPQSEIDYWKAQYDFQKHMMTISLAFIGGFGGLLGSVFKGEVAAEGWGLKEGLIVVTFIGFFALLISSYLASGVARRNMSPAYLKSTDELRGRE